MKEGIKNPKVWVEKTWPTERRGGWWYAAASMESSWLKITFWWFYAFFCLFPVCAHCATQKVQYSKVIGQMNFIKLINQTAEISHNSEGQLSAKKCQLCEFDGQFCDSAVTCIHIFFHKQASTYSYHCCLLLWKPFFAAFKTTWIQWSQVSCVRWQIWNKKVNTQ